MLRHPHLMPYTRGDGRLNCITRSDGTTPYFPGREGWCEGRVDGKMPTVDDTRLLLEDREDRVLIVRNGESEGGWRLPGCAAVESFGGDAIDCGNVIECLSDHAEAELGVRPPWMSWLTDRHRHTPGVGSGEHIRRVYAHRLQRASADDSAALVAESGGDDARWVDRSELESLARAGELEEGSEELRWLEMWQVSVKAVPTPALAGLCFHIDAVAAL